jgi:hypothetical protein
MKLKEILPTSNDYLNQVYTKLDDKYTDMLLKLDITPSRLYDSFIYRYNARYVKDEVEFLNQFIYLHQKYILDMINRYKLFDSPNFVDGVFVNSASNQVKGTKPSSNEKFENDLVDQVLSSGSQTKSQVSDTLTSAGIMFEKVILEAISYFIDLFDTLFISPVVYSQKYKHGTEE